MKPFQRVTLWYAVFGVLWVSLTDQLLNAFGRELGDLTTYLQSFKGLIFVTLSTCLIFYLTRRAFLREQREEEARRAAFHKAVSRSYHILLNYLNQMALVTMEAERCLDFDREVLRLARRISDEATTELMKLDHLNDSSPDGDFRD